MNFYTYFKLGIDHITDPNGYDHILFIIAMSAIFSSQQWKAILWLVSAFTIGHSLALILATLELVPVWTALIEFLIPVTILLTCIQNIWKAPSLTNTPTTQIAKNYTIHFGTVLFFGLIHGLGFSNFLSATLIEGEQLFTPLLAFNLGLEFGQLLIVAIIFLINFVFLRLLNRPIRDWTLFISGIVTGLAFLLFLEKWKLLFYTTS